MAMTLRVRVWQLEDRDWNVCGENIVKKEIGGSKVVVLVSTKTHDTDPFWSNW